MKPRKATGSDFTHLALWMAGTLAGVVTAALLARGPFFRALIRRAGWAKRSARSIGGGGGAKRPTPAESLPLLADAVLGNSKCAVAAVFGPPPGGDPCGGDEQARQLLGGGDLVLPAAEERPPGDGDPVR